LLEEEDEDDDDLEPTGEVEVRPDMEFIFNEYAVELRKPFAIVDFLLFFYLSLSPLFLISILSSLPSLLFM
jgi:hypothetical protein